MNSIQINASMLQNPQNLQMLQNIKNAAGNGNLASQAQNGDFFAAFLQSLQVGQTGAQGINADIAGAILGEQNPDEQDGESDENTAAMELASGLLSGNYGFDWLLPVASVQNDYTGENNSQVDNSALSNLQNLNGLISGGQNTELMQILGQTPQPAQGETGVNAEQNPFAQNGETSSQMLQQLALLQQAESAKAQNNAAATAQQQTAGTAGTNTQAQTQNVVTGWQPSVPSKTEFQLHTVKTDSQNQAKSALSSQRTIEILPTVTENASGFAKSSSEQLFDGNMNFQNAIALAQKALKEKGNSSFGEEPVLQGQDLSQTMTQVGTNELQIPQALNSTGKSEIDTADLFEQVKNGVKNGSLTQAKELSVKLKPEGLGEVTIRLVKEQNQITVQIVTASEQTAKLLNDQLPNLRQTMQSLQTEVRDVIISQQQSQDNQQFNQQMNQQGQNNGQNNAQSGFYGNSSDSSNFSGTEKALMQELENGGMEIYA